MVSLKDILPDPNDPQEQLKQSAAKRLAENIESLNRSSIDISKLTKQSSAFEQVLEQLAEKKETPFVRHFDNHEIVRSTAAARRIEDEKLALMRRQTLASEEALAAARRGEAEARKQAQRANAFARIGAIVGLAGFLLAAWPYITAWWQ